MNGIVKVLTGILAIVAVAACITTVVIIGYSMTSQDEEGRETTAQTSPPPVEDSAEQTPVPEQTPQTPAAEPTQTPAPVEGAAEHTHDYAETVDKKATCYRAGRIKYTCRECEDTYYVDVMSTGHVPGDWEVLRKPSRDENGMRVMKCIYCDEIVAQESIAMEKENDSEKDEDGEDKEEGPHIHQYTAQTEREPSCILAGLRKYSCSCGNFYTEMIPAAGHVASDWDVAAEATEKKMGTEQRTCAVCGVVLDSRPINKLTPSPSASPSASAQSTGTPSSSASPGASSSPAPSASPSASPSPTPHSHEYQSYVLKEANCSETGIRSYICTCGSSYAEVIERDLNRHSYRAVVIPATSATQGYTAYTCTRCNYSYFDNYTPAIGQ